ncbi:retrovirus-related pol polyprotein from transposon TNT 1-94 [Tanacetum coccineum]|uniref:Retrovirus-related pol polyprotein from transposon TNT 1-94 n=1 Tax=Tanacetum coccineum TaxID=301880 RepID=A0ABQ5CV68_9ASTR
MNVINMSMRLVQVNTKFINSLPPKWSKFVTDVKLVRYLHTTNYDQLYSYLEQHEVHANETHLMRERYQDPLAFVANYNQPPPQLTNYHSQYNPTHVPQQTNDMIPQVHSAQSFSPIYKGNATSSGGNNTGGQARVVKCYNCQGEGHMARQCTQPKRPRNAAWFKEKEMLTKAQEAGQILDEEQLAFLADAVGQSAQTVHMLTKPQVFYDDTHKQALGYQNLFHLKKAQRIKLTLYDGSVISSQHVASPVIDDEETLILEELNRLSEDFDKHFVPQQELSNEQAFWLQTSRPNTDQSALSPVKIVAPRELPKESLVNTSLKKLKYHLGQFDAVVKKRITSDAIIEGEWGSESCVKCLNLDTELLNKQNELNDLSKKYFENNDLKAQLQDKDTTIYKLKEHIKTMRENEKEEKVKHEMDKIETINIELEHSMFKLDLDPLAPRLLQNRDAHINYLKHTQEQADILQGIVAQAKAKQPLDNALDFAFETPKPEIKVYSRIPKQIKLVGSSKKAKIVESKIANNSEPNHLWGSNTTDVPYSSSLVNDRLFRLFSGTIRFRNDEVAKIMGYGDYQLGNILKSLFGKTLALFGIYKVLIYCQIRAGYRHRRLSHPQLRFLRSKDEALDAIIKCIKNIQVHLNTIVRNVITNNRTEFVNQTFCDFYENVSISHQTYVARTPQQNGVIKRQNRTLVEASRTMLIFSKVPLFLWAEAINTACYTQNRSLIRLRYNKTPYELMHDKKPDLSFLHVFGSLCYPTNDS